MHVVITGAGRGIGKVLADRYRAQECDVTGTARDGSAEVALDVTDPKQHQAMAEKLAMRPVDLLVCNAGVYLDKSQTIDGYPAEMWAQSFAANVTGVFLTVQALLPNLRAAQGKIAILSSQMASHTRAPGGSYIYRSSKAAVLNLGRNLAVDLRGDGISVGIYHPGWVQTDMGGTGADITVDKAVQGLINRFDTLSLESTGCFETYEGQSHPY
ncbi:SDR family NAD(P)-dependent oxidoreductase [Ruegeria faecimaris]|uniref:NAD(P)-dependent dehydrogenase, short-chain alcohol dehydrogenase family n=1 Tax=Ruegeria faecimaris TaxID=686389 RepID=A0A521DXX2_9RHOB|nr:SDR family NAD(P)-dependent oxidoreductase [Ruegeria faecimaris]SMO76462.1 NAD(P)-dependent dehydrogenase, short-chain alcohol dehydrogenase family [Ruegeria faecimaris]